jgi:hypothetical protein
VGTDSKPGIENQERYGLLQNAFAQGAVVIENPDRALGSIASLEEWF